MHLHLANLDLRLGSPTDREFLVVRDGVEGGSGTSVRVSFTDAHVKLSNYAWLLASQPPGPMLLELGKDKPAWQ